jgi:glycosyltransferase involved in cell wall biosynthesis
MSYLADRLVEEGIEVHYASMRCPEHQSIQFHQVPGWFARSIQNAVTYGSTLSKVAKSASLQEGRIASVGGLDRVVTSKLRPILLKVSMRSYQSVLSRINADVYLQVNAGSPTGYVATFCRKKGKPFIFRSTSLWDADLAFTRGFRSWRDDTKMLYAQGVRNADMIAANSRDTAKAFTKYVEKERVRFMPDGFRILPCPRSSRKGGYVLWVGRDRPYKRPWLYVNLARMLPRHQFVMVGNIRGIGDAPPNLHLLGEKKPSEISEIYSGAKVLVNTSEVEGFPNVLIEAGMHLVPYVGFLDPDGVVSEYSLGLLVNDLSSMAAATDTLMNAEHLRIRLGKNARQFVEEQRDIDKVVKKWLLLFEEITNRNE